MQQELICKLQQDGKTSITPWVYEHATAVLAAARTRGDVGTAADAALTVLPQGYAADKVQPVLLAWAQL